MGWLSSKLVISRVLPSLLLLMLTRCACRFIRPGKNAPLSFTRANELILVCAKNFALGHASGQNKKSLWPSWENEPFDSVFE